MELVSRYVKAPPVSRAWYRRRKRRIEKARKGMGDAVGVTASDGNGFRNANAHVQRALWNRRESDVSYVELGQPAELYHDPGLLSSSPLLYTIFIKTIESFSTISKFQKGLKGKEIAFEKTQGTVVPMIVQTSIHCFI
ncbi:hypothetical protein V1478_012152 [Vespula squamosa]|uniref:Uncharacterized protein n=1 Tax=Vespula squamosa TaxID=30214 RepID=A0ABD2ACH0_VESSQ